VRVRGATKDEAGALNVPVVVAGARIRPGDIVVLDADGVAVVEAERVDEVLAAALDREEKERVKGEKLASGLHSYDLDGLRERVEGAR
jgi:4-hydroxy-4-methyl-2-oxoglutarate aldolase